MANLQERGDIFFLYRPKVQNEKPQSIDEIQRMYIVLRPEAPTDNEQPQVERADKEFGVEISDNVTFLFLGTILNKAFFSYNFVKM